MLTALLWILLALAVAVWITATSPIRFGAAGTFGKSKRPGGRFWLSYIHPALFLYEYSSAGHKERAVIFGIDAKRFGRKKRKREDVDNSSNTDDIDVDKSNSIGDINTKTSAGDGDDAIMTKLLRRLENIKGDPIYTKTMDTLSDIKSGLSYRHLKDKNLRKKIVRWLKRAGKCAVTAVRFDKLKFYVAAGLADPSQTGKMYGYFIAAKSALSLRNKIVSMEMKPVFTEKRLEAEMEFACRTSIALILSNTLTATLTFPYWQVRKLTRGT